jgi:hypothetical protein
MALLSDEAEEEVRECILGISASVHAMNLAVIGYLKRLHRVEGLDLEMEE